VPQSQGAVVITKTAAVIGGVGGLILAFVIYQLVNTLWFLPGARNEGRNLYIAKQAVADRKAELGRKGDDATLQTLTDYNLCVAGLRGNRMPINPCDQLRGPSQEQPVP
jgi:hypothetical protein